MHARNLETQPGLLARERSGGFVVYRDSSEAYAEVVASLLPDPDRLFAAGQVIQSPWHSSATDKTVVTIGDESYFLKRYNCLGGVYRLKNMFRDSKAFKSWWAAWKFLELGLPTPRPIVCLEEQSFRLLGRSYLLFELISGSQSLLDIWTDLPEDLRREVLSLLGTEVGKMHRQGLLHGDLNWRNVLVREAPGTIEVFFADLDGCSFSRQPTMTQVENDLKHFWRDFSRANAEKHLSELFMKSWHRQCGLVIK